MSFLQDPKEEARLTGIFSTGQWDPGLSESGGPFPWQMFQVVSIVAQDRQAHVAVNFPDGRLLTDSFYSLMDRTDGGFTVSPLLNLLFFSIKDLMGCQV